MMRSIFIACMLLSGFARAANQEDLFKKGIDLYQAGDYQKAYDSLSLIDKKTPATWFNLACCAYKLDKKIDALIFWYKAAFYSRGALHQHSVENVKMTLKKLGLQPCSDLKLSTFFIIPLLLWQLLFLLVLLLCFIFVPRLARKRQWYMLGALIIIALALVAGLSRAYYDSWYIHALVIKDRVSLYAGPDEQFEVLGTLPLASTVRVLERAQGWYKIDYNNQHGWAVGTTMALIDED